MNGSLLGFREPSPPGCSRDPLPAALGWSWPETQLSSRGTASRTTKVRGQGKGPDKAWSEWILEVRGLVTSECILDLFVSHILRIVSVVLWLARANPLEHRVFPASPSSEMGAARLPQCEVQICMRLSGTRWADAPTRRSIRSRLVGELLRSKRDLVCPKHGTV